MLILLPPSEGKSEIPGKSSFRDAEPALLPNATAVLRWLKRQPRKALPALYKVSSPEKALEIHQRNLALFDAPVLPAIQRYSGVVYDHIAFDTLTTPAHARKRLLIVSALFGLIPASAQIPWYKLGMTPQLAKLWRPINTRRLHEFAQGQPVLDLLPQASARALDYPHRITVDFKLAGGKKSAGHFGKAIKGKFVRFLLENKITRVEDFTGFTEDGYRFDGKDFVQG
ncbi:MAG: peroxide stress protein YaaA [Candidatus Hydrogenedentes bacterium]|nr:peroxide stress protein YaaA [Candidatus Hydrogenedentota bacterium]